MSKKTTVSEFITKANLAHNNKYDYSLITKYVNNKCKLPICCKIHGVFYQTPNAHTKKKPQGCPECGRLQMAKTQALTNEQFKYKAELIHGGKYNYDNVNYINNHHHLNIYCNECKTFFNQTGNDHLDGCGCPRCQGGSFNPSKRAILYYLSINNGQAYKIGITNRSIESRFTSLELSKIKVINIIEYSYGIDAKLAESLILEDFKYAKYTGEDLLNSGNTELFKYDILGLDNDN